MTTTTRSQGSYRVQNRFIRTLSVASFDPREKPFSVGWRTRPTTEKINTRGYEHTRVRIGLKNAHEKPTRRSPSSVYDRRSSVIWTEITPQSHMPTLRFHAYTCNAGGEDNTRSRSDRGRVRTSYTRLACRHDRPTGSFVDFPSSGTQSNTHTHTSRARFRTSRSLRRRYAKRADVRPSYIWRGYVTPPERTIKGVRRRIPKTDRHTTSNRDWRIVKFICVFFMTCVCVCAILRLSSSVV